MSTAIPHLSINGWISDNSTKMTKLYEYFLTSEHSQSNTFINKIASLKYIIQKHAGTSEIESAIKSSLYNMYIRYYKEVTVIITTAVNDDSVTYSTDISAVDFDNKVNKLSNNINVSGSNILNMDTLMSNLRGIQ